MFGVIFFHFGDGFDDGVGHEDEEEEGLEGA